MLRKGQGQGYIVQSQNHSQTVPAALPMAERKMEIGRIGNVIQSQTVSYSSGGTRMSSACS